MKDKTVILAYLILFCCIPLITPNTGIQAITDNSNKVNYQTFDNSTGFYVYEGNTNNLLAYLNEQNEVPRFQTFYGSGADYWIRYNWQDVVGGSNSYEITYPDHGSDPVKPQWLYDHGINLSVKIMGGAYNPFEICYNSTYRTQIINEGLATLNSIPYINAISTISLGDEAPATLFNWKGFPSGFSDPMYSVYNVSMHAETGVWMRTNYDQNATENWIYQNWLDNKTMWAMNAIYDGIKQVYPNKQVGWNTMKWAGLEPTLLKGDFIAGGYYTNDVKNFYGQIRFAKLLGPNKSINSIIQGDNSVPLGIPDSQQQQFFWTSYFAGGTEVQIVAGGNNQIYNSIGNTNDLNQYEFHSALYKIANTLPVLNPKPLVLSINALRGDSIGTVPAFREFDATTQFQAELPAFSLNQYKIIVLQDQFQLTDQLTSKLTNYINSGGNLILKGWLQSVVNPNNASGQLKSSFLPLEIGSSLKTLERTDTEIINFKSSLFNSIIPNIVVANRMSLNFTNSPDWTPIPTGLPEEALGYYPIALYHNVTNPNSGYILYYGFDMGSDENGYIPIIRDYVQNYLHLNDLIAPADNPDILVSTSLDNYNRTIIGIIPGSTSSNDLISVNVTERNLPQENVWDYNGTTDEYWMGSAYDPTNPSGMATFQTTLTPYSAQRWVLSPELPSADPDLRVFLQYPSADPYVGEQIPITVNINEGLQYVNLDNFSIKLTVTQGLHISQPSNQATQTVNQLPAMTDNYFQWLITADTAGLYHLGLTITSLNLTRTFDYAFSLQINDGRLEISLPNVFHYTPTDKMYLTGILTYQGSKPQTYEISTLMQDYLWGNPGGFYKNITFNPGEAYQFTTLVNAINPSPGSSGAFEVFAFNEQHTTISESYVLIKIYPALLQCTPLQLINGKITTSISIDGSGYINNVKAALYIGNSEVSNSDRFLGTLSTNSSNELTWDSSSIPNPSTLTLIVSGNSVPSISEQYSLPLQQSLLNFIFSGASVILLAFIGSLFGLYAFDMVKKGKIFKR